MKKAELIPVACVYSPDGEMPIYALHDPAVCFKDLGREILPRCSGCRVEILVEWMAAEYRPELDSTRKPSEGGNHAES